MVWLSLSSRFGGIWRGISVFLKKGKKVWQLGLKVRLTMESWFGCKKWWFNDSNGMKYTVFWWFWVYNEWENDLVYDWGENRF